MLYFKLWRHLLFIFSVITNSCKNVNFLLSISKKAILSILKNMKTIYNENRMEPKWSLPVYIEISNLADLSQRWPNTPFSLATIPRCKEGCYYFSWIAPLTLDLYLVMSSVKQGDIKYYFFESLLWLDLGLNPSLLDHLQTFFPLYQWVSRWYFL